VTYDIAEICYKDYVQFSEFILHLTLLNQLLISLFWWFLGGDI